MNTKLSMNELNRLDITQFKDSEKFPFVLVLDDIRSMNNVGSAFRTADSFRCSHLYLCGITAKPPHREISKTALGADESVEWTYFETPSACITHLKEQGFILVCIEQVKGAMSTFEFVPDRNHKYAFVFGNEVFGVNDLFLSAADLSLEIPQFGTKHSLNVSVCLGIISYDFISKIIK